VFTKMHFDQKKKILKYSYVNIGLKPSQTRPPHKAVGRVWETDLLEEQKKEHKKRKRGLTLKGIGSGVMADVLRKVEGVSTWDSCLGNEAEKKLGGRLSGLRNSYYSKTWV